MPKSNRPPEIRSSVAACSANSTGLCHGSTITAVPSRKVRGAHGERRLQHQGGGDLVPAGEMMLDQEARAKAQRLGLDGVVEIVAEALPGLRAEIAACWPGPNRRYRIASCEPTANRRCVWRG